MIRLVLVLGWLTAGEALANEPVLLFSQSSVFQFTIGITMPIAMDPRGGLASTTGFQFNYNLPWNLTQFEPITLHARSERQVQQQQQAGLLRLENIYAALEELLERQGWNDGRQCLLRAICELSGTPLHRGSGDALEEMLHLLLTPSEDNGTESAYRRAERLGEDEANCRRAYGGCLESPLESFTEIAFR